MINAKWLQSVIKVGDGRGFVMADDQENLVVVTTAHCLPHLPEAHPGSARWERTYEQLLGRLGDEPSIAAEVLFVDPVADIAILGPPDNEELWEQAEAYSSLVEFAAPMPMAKLEFVRKTYTFRDDQTSLGFPEAEADAWLLGLDGEWFSCRVSCLRAPRSIGGIGISDAATPIVGGMSGSPVMVQGGVIGIVSISFGGDAGDRQGGPQAYLPLALPGWMLDG
jgi:hypothetical protein